MSGIVYSIETGKKALVTTNELFTANGLKEYTPPSKIYMADEGFEGKE